jgi:hypothetical protein
MVAAAFATEGASAPLLASMKVGRMSRILMEGTALGSSNAAITAAASEFNPKITTEDVIASFGLGMFLGGAVGTLRRNPHTQEEANALATAGKGIMRNQDAPPVSVPAAGSAGAAATGDRPFLMSDTPIIDQADAPTAAFGSIRYDIGGRLGSSESSITRSLAPHFGEEAVGFADHSVVPDAATTVKQMLRSRLVAAWEREALPAAEAWAKEQGKWAIGKRMSRWPSHRFARSRDRRQTS